MHKILVVTIEPPQTSSGLGTLWAKLASQIETNKLQIDFLGPNPELCSPYGKSGIQIKGKLHYVSPPPLSWFLSVKRNKNKGIQKFFWSILYFPFVIQKYVFKSSQNSYLDWFSSQCKENKQPLKFIIVGKVHDKQQRKILNDAHTKISYSDLMPYAEARLTAQNADFYMISVSARHMDNIPSKLVDLMSFKRPILLLAHPQSEASKEILSLGIGLSAHPQDENGIYEAIQKLVLDKEKFISAYENTSISTSWRCSSVASSFSDSLISMLTS